MNEKMTTAAQADVQAQQLYLSKDHGVLSTISVHLDGYPFGSVVSYTADEYGLPIVLLSTIAQHTKNVEADDRCSLTILANAGGNVQAEARLTITGHLLEAENDLRAVRRYERFYPASASYRKAHDFSLFRLRPTACRFIGGFGRIHWLEPDEVFLPSPFDEETESYIIDHMNADHESSLRQYFSHYLGKDVPENQKVSMCGIDASGFNVLAGDRTHRFHSPKMMSDAKVAREVLVEMAKMARQSD